MESFKVQILSAVSSNWYDGYKFVVFEVTSPSHDSITYRVVNSPYNRNLMKKDEHLHRLTGKSLGKLGIRRAHTQRVSLDSNKDAKFLLTQEVD